MTGHVPTLEETRFDALADKVQITSKRSRSTRKLMMLHIDRCEKWQKWGVRVGLLTLGWIITHSPEASAAFSSILKALAE